MIRSYDGKKNVIKFMGYCPFCGRPVLFTEEQTRTVKSCPICDAPIAFAEYINIEEDKIGYNILPSISGESYCRNGYTVENGTLVGYDSELADIVTPPGVIAIAANLFKGNTRIKSITVSDGVKYIGPETFRGCDGVRELTLPDELFAIGNCAFAGCRRLKQVKLPKALVAAGYSIFHSCENLTELLLPMDMKYLGGSPYGFCKKLKKANIPHCVFESGVAWFQENDNLEVLIIGSNLRSLTSTPPHLREAHFAATEGWYELGGLVGQNETEIAQSSLQNTKTAAMYLNKRATKGRTIYRPDAPSIPYWLSL